MPTVEDGAGEPDRRRLVARGLTWSAFYQVFDVGVSVAAMLVLVRLLGPAEYGRASAVVGILTLLNTFNAAIFVSHALQLPDDVTPDWQLHWTAAFYIQLVLSGLCHAIAVGCWFVQDYRPIAPLLHLAAIGFIFDWPNQFGAMMLMRELNLRRVRTVMAAGTLLRLGCTIAVAAGGGGAFALVLGNNVVSSLPFGTDLLLVRGWRPRPGWWRMPTWSAYREPARFGVQRVGAALVWGVSSALESVVLPSSLGFAAVGLLTRARALYNTTLGRIANIVLETAYPFLPREAARADRYARQAGRFLKLVLLLAVPGALFLGIEGRQVSRVLYGQRWVTMDALILPGALAGLSVTVLTVASLVLMAAGRMRECLRLETVATVMAVAALGAAWLSGNALVYCWVLAIGGSIAATVAFARTALLLEQGWVSTVLMPPVVVTTIAMIGGAAVGQALGPVRSLVHFGVVASVYSVSGIAALRLLYPETWTDLLQWVPGRWAIRFGRQPVVTAAEPGVSP